MSWPKSDLAEVQEKIAWMLRLEEDFSEFYELCRTEPSLAQVPQNRLGRLLRSGLVRRRDQDDPHHQHHLAPDQGDVCPIGGVPGKALPARPHPPKLSLPQRNRRGRRGFSSQRSTVGCRART